MKKISLLMFMLLLAAGLLIASERASSAAPRTLPAAGITGPCFFCPTPTPAPPQPPVIRHPTWNSGKLYIDAAASYIAYPGAQLQVSRSGLPTQSWPLSFDESGTRFVAGGSNSPSSPSGYLLHNFMPAGIPVTLVVRNPDGMQSNSVAFQR